MQLNQQIGLNVIDSNIVFKTRTAQGTWQDVSVSELFSNKKVVLFSLPGAFTPTCSSSHLPRYEALFSTFKDHGIDEVYCVSVNDTFVMNEWAKAQEVENVKVIPDGNAEFTKYVGMAVQKDSLGFGIRSWRYAMVLDNGVVTHHFIEPDKEGDPFEVSDADTVLGVIAPHATAPKNIVLLTKEGCPFCLRTKEFLNKHSINYSEMVLNDAKRQKVLSAITGDKAPTVPVAFIDGVRVSGSDAIVEALK